MTMEEPKREKPEGNATLTAIYARIGVWLERLSRDGTIQKRTIGEDNVEYYLGHVSDLANIKKLWGPKTDAAGAKKLKPPARFRIGTSIFLAVGAVLALLTLLTRGFVLVLLLIAGIYYWPRLKSWANEDLRLDKDRDKDQDSPKDDS